MPMNKNKNFVTPSTYQVLIPYADLEKMVNMARELEEIRKQNKRIEAQYAAIRGMFSECLEKIKEIQDFVKD